MQHQTSCGRLTEKEPAEGVGHSGRICCYNGKKPPFIARRKAGKGRQHAAERAHKAVLSANGPARGPDKGPTLSAKASL